MMLVALPKNFLDVRSFFWYHSVIPGVLFLESLPNVKSLYFIAFLFVALK